MADEPLCDPNYKHAAWSKYRFVPSLAANTVFVVLFGLTTLFHLVQVWRTKTWYMTAMLCGAAFEFVGYIGRVISATQDEGCWTLGPYIMQTLLILVAPALMAASIYMILARIILLTNGEHYALIKRKWLTKFFVCGDVLSFAMQGAGGGIMAGGEKSMKTGEKIIIIGLFIQLVIFGGFIAVAGLFHYRMGKAPTAEAQDPKVRWGWYLLILYVAGGLIWVRSLFRVIEYIEGNDGKLMQSEVYVFVFDAALMFITCIWVNWFHPSEIGLLLRGEEPLTGLQLLTFQRRRKRVYSSQSESYNTIPLEEQRRDNA